MRLLWSALSVTARMGTVFAWLFLAALVFATADAQQIQAPTRVSPYDWACLAANGAVLSNHQRFDTALFACLDNAQGAEIVGGRYRLNRPSAPPPDPPACPAQPADDTRDGVCPAGTTGAWTQTRTYSSAASPICWQAGEWLPVAPPAGACSAPPPATLPAPTAISATVSASTTSPGNYNVALSWLTVAGAERYAIERCTGASCTSNFIALGTTTNTAYTNSNIPAGLTYRYRIRGTSASATGTWSALRSVTTPTPTTPPPPPPAGTGTASLSWTPPTQNTDGTALTNLAGYRIVYGTAAGSLTRTIQVPNAALSTYVVDALAAGTWYFAVSAYTSNGFESERSNVTSKVVQ